MKKYNLKKENVKFHNIVIAVTTQPDYEMDRYLLLEHLKDLNYNEFVIVEGYHCSCYDFDETKWEAIIYTKKELIKIAEDRISSDCWHSEEKQFYKLVLEYIK